MEKRAKKRTVCAAALLSLMALPALAAERFTVRFSGNTIDVESLNVQPARLLNVQRK